MGTAQERYKRNNYMRVRTTIRIFSGYKVFLGNLPEPAHADACGSETIIQTELRSPVFVPHYVIRSTYTTVSIVVDGAHDPVSLDQIERCRHPTPRCRAERIRSPLAPHG